MTKPTRVLWMQAGSCGGCTMSALGAGDRGLMQSLAPFGLEVVWHPALSEASGGEALDLLAAAAEGRFPFEVLCVEGSILRGPHGSGRFQMMPGTDRSMADWVAALAEQAEHVVAMGSCACFGGIPAAGDTGTEACGLQFEGEQDGGLLGSGFRGRGGLPVINVAGCAPHPGWMLETLVALALGEMTTADLDAFGRPRFFADHLAHHGCARNEFYEFKASATALSQRGCLMENLGCKATQAAGDCNQRIWSGASGCCPDAGFPCIACTSPGFETPGGSFMETPKVAGIPVGLPVDMPKAWFIALAALSKSATPSRVRANAGSDRLTVPPVRKVHQP